MAWPRSTAGTARYIPHSIPATIEGQCLGLQAGRGHHLPQERNRTIRGRGTYVCTYIGASYHN